MGDHICRWPGEQRNTYVWSIEEFEKIAYMATFNSDFFGDASLGDLGDIDLSEIDPSMLLNFVSAKPEMFYSTDGLNWEQIPLPSLLEGWGIWNYGIRNMEVGGEKLCGGNKLFLGTATNLFAPDANELIELIIALIASGEIPLEEMPTYIDASLLLSIDAIPPEELLAFIDFILVQLIGPGTQIWAAETVDMLPPPECSTSICPLFATVYPGDEVQFSTTGDGDCNMVQFSAAGGQSCKDPCYTWELSLMGSTGSEIDENGLYTAGDRMGMDIVTVTDECNGGSSASAAVIIKPDSIPPIPLLECFGDFDFDNDVDGTDAQTFKSSFGRSSLSNPCSEENPCKGDFDCDADCDGTDADTFKKDFGRSLLKNPCPLTAASVSCSY